jgi:hypothetical protein
MARTFGLKLLVELGSQHLGGGISSPTPWASILASSHSMNSGVIIGDGGRIGDVRRCGGHCYFSIVNDADLYVACLT